jgi:ABC-type glycerol-3-phosphate transport system permease component
MSPGAALSRSGYWAVLSAAVLLFLFPIYWIVAMIRFEDARWATIAAGATVVALPVVVFSIRVRRYLVSGLTGGAVKQ